MSDKQGPALTSEIQEVQGTFPDDAHLQDALGRLTLSGFDRADISLPQDQAGRTWSTPNAGAENPVDEIDKTQLRTMGTSMAGYAGAAAVAGATVATGGAAAVALAAAAAVGAGSALLANAAGQAADAVNTEAHDERGRAGTLILAVRVTSADEVAKAEAAMAGAGATKSVIVTRGMDMLTAGVSAASWTGGRRSGEF
jgi:hypothetical protein